MDVCAWCPFLTPRQQNRAPYSSLLRTNTLFCDPPLAIFTKVPYIPTYPWPRYLYMTVLKIANDFLSVECFAEEKLLGGISHHFQMCSLFTASFEELGDFQYVGSVFSLDIFFSKLLIEIWFKTPIVAFNRKMQWNYSFTSIESKAFILDVSNLLSHIKT